MTWAALIVDLLHRKFDNNQSRMSQAIDVSQQTISLWIAGQTPSVHGVHAVFQVHHYSMLRLLSIAYGWPLHDIARRSLLDAAIAASQELDTDEQRQLFDQYGTFLDSKLRLMSDPGAS